MTTSTTLLVSGFVLVLLLAFPLAVAAGHFLAHGKKLAVAALGCLIAGVVCLFAGLWTGGA